MVRDNRNGEDKNINWICISIFTVCFDVYFGVCVCVCVCVRVRVLHYYRGPQPEYTPSTEDRTDVRGRLGRQIFFYALNHRQSEEGRVK